MNETRTRSTPVKTVADAAAAPLVATYSPSQADRLGCFRNILRTVYAQEAHVRVGTPRVFGRYEGETLVESYMRLDGRFLRTWNHVLESMYRTEFADDATLRQAAKDIVTQAKREFDGPDAMSADDLSALFARSAS